MVLFEHATEAASLNRKIVLDCAGDSCSLRQTHQGIYWKKMKPHNTCKCLRKKSCSRDEEETAISRPSTSGGHGDEETNIDLKS